VDESVNITFADDPLPNRAGETWRTWLMTGARRGPIDRRRVRGAHIGIKRMLVEGMRVPGDQAYTWKEFSDAMVRQSVGDAMRTLGHRDAQLVKLAYFGGLTNGEIARHTGLNESNVQRRLRMAIEAISRHVESGRRLGQRVIVAVAVWLSGRWAGDALHGAIQGAAVAAAAAIIAAHPAAAPSIDRGPARPAVEAPAAAPVVPPVPSPTAPVTATQAQSPAAAVSSTVTSAVPAVQVPSVQLPAVPVQAPPVPQVTSPVTTEVKKLL
jgi:hypothetical protein